MRRDNWTGWVEHLVENKTAKQLVDLLDDNVFDDIVAMTTLDCTGDEASEISEIELEEIIFESVTILLKGRKLSAQAIEDMCSDFKVSGRALVEDGIILELDGEYYEDENV